MRRTVMVSRTASSRASRVLSMSSAMAASWGRWLDAASLPALAIPEAAELAEPLERAKPRGQERATWTTRTGRPPVTLRTVMVIVAPFEAVIVQYTDPAATPQLPNV